jgi:hypothetical protein
VITRGIDENLPPVITRAAPWVVSARDASVVLAILGTGAMLNFLGVLFSIGLAALPHRGRIGGTAGTIKLLEL